MKHLFILSLLLLWAVCLLANPMEFLLVSEFWFDTQGMHIELCPSFDSNLVIPLSNLRFIFNGETAMIPDTQDSLFYNNPVVINMEELNPPLYINQGQGGTVAISMSDNAYPGEEINWTSTEPPNDGSLVHWYYHGWHWAIEIPPTPGTHPYNPLTRGIVWIWCHDQYVQPIGGVNIDLIMDGNHSGVTDFNGVYRDTLYASPLTVRAHSPYYPNLAFVRNFWLPPNESTEVAIMVITHTNIDEVPAASQTVLTIYPVPYRFTQNSGLNFQLPDTVKQSRQVKLKIYNAKGQYVTELTSRQGNLLQWQPNGDIAAGIYTVRLICGNRIVETGHFSLLK